MDQEMEAEKLNLSVVLMGEANARRIESLTLDLKAEIEQASRYSIPVRENHHDVSGSLGPEWLPILTAVVAAPITSEVVKGLFGIVSSWISRQRGVSVTIEGPKGKVTFSNKNIPPSDVEAAVRLIMG